jgi:TonB family protein
MTISEKKNRLTGFLGTLAFHILVLCVFIFFGLSVPLPLPAEQGVEVNLGNSDDGSGNIQPRELANSEQAQPTPTNNAEDEIVSEDNNETPKLISTKSKDSKTEKTKPTVEKPVEKQVNTTALFNRKTNNSNQGGNEGVTGKNGDQGNPDGSLYSKNHDGKPDGKGNSGKPGANGISYNLKGRSHLKLPLPDDSSQKEGTVVVEIKVNSNGDVIYANPGIKGSNTIDKHLYNVAKEAALKAKFDKKTGAPDQNGTITYHFVLQ